jgi:hypothetical protein
LHLRIWMSNEYAIAERPIRTIAREIPKAQRTVFESNRL